MDYEAIMRLCRKVKMGLPRNLKIRERYWYAAKGAKLGWLAVQEKYGRVPGDPEYRKTRWRAWWEQKGRFQKHPIIGVARQIRKPKYSAELAEFVGIVLGDGCITRYQIMITLHHIDDKEYGKFVKRLVSHLFGVPVGESHRENYSVINYAVSRVELVRFCVNKLGLYRGNKVKQQVGVPDWIERNQTYRIACARGLMDTDGSVFLHRYKVNRKEYEYKKMAFSNSSKPLAVYMFRVLKEVGLSPRVARGGKEVRIDSIVDMEKYFHIISSHNPKHLKRYQNRSMVNA